MPKNIIILSDGTGQEGGKGHDTNVYKLFRMLEDRTERQIVFYDQGLGTDGDKVGGMAFGRGIDTNILQCYRFLFDHYRSGDRIFLFGFSRGAATVRSLASFIHYFGILPTARPELINQAYRIYKNRKRSYDQAEAGENAPQARLKLIDKLVRNFNNARQYNLDDPKHGASAEFVRKHPNQWVNIEFLGVWDTVPALGLVALPGLNALLDLLPAWKHQYHNFKLRESVKHACHALSIDDKRKWFLPSIWKEYGRQSSQKVEQVWFGGSHSDVGGGFWEAGFSDASLEWMVGKALEHGLRLYPGSQRYWNFCIAPDATDDFHDPQSAWGRFYPSSMRDHVWDKQAQETFGPPVIHRSVFDRVHPGSGWKYKPWILDHCLDEAQIEAAYGRWLEMEYYYQTRQDHERLREKKITDLPLDEWRKLSGSPFEVWKTRYPMEVWRQEHVLQLDSDYGPEVAGKSFLVENIRKIEYRPDDQAVPFRLRDYDRDDLPTLEEERYKSIQERVRMLDPQVLASLSRSERRKILSNPVDKYYVHRIDRDARRWKIEWPPRSTTRPK
jgi:uncharacterized protein (DUF2235 family)